MSKTIILSTVRTLTEHPFAEIVLRGNAAILAALSILPKGSTILIPQEGGWLTYRTLPPKIGLQVQEVCCVDAELNLDDLHHKLEVGNVSALLYQQPGGYFAQQPMREIYELCRSKGCLVIIDVSGAIGTLLCNGRYADILVGSFGEWKLVEAKVGGFISCRDEQLWKKIEPTLELLKDDDAIHQIEQSLAYLPKRIAFLAQKVTQIKRDLQHLSVVCPSDISFVVVIKFSSPDDKEEIIQYCQEHHLEWTQCPRYIRVNKQAISIEVKRLQCTED